MNRSALDYGVPWFVFSMFSYTSSADIFCTTVRCLRWLVVNSTIPSHLEAELEPSELSIRNSSCLSKYRVTIIGISGESPLCDEIKTT